jgi:hypothetical protein
MTTEISPKYGLVTIFDALGVKNANIESSQRFIKNIQSIQSDLGFFMSSHFSAKGRFIYDEVKEHYKSNPPEVLTFGDTVLIIWEIGNPESIDKYLITIGKIASSLIVSGLHYETLFRAALSYGYFIRNEHVVIGPAISDAASWHENTEWIGIMATPYCSNLISKFELTLTGQDILKSAFYDTYIRYNIPTKEKEIEAWAIAWPNLIKIYRPYSTKLKFYNNTPLSWYYSQIDKFQIPFKTENKYFNTEYFIKKVLKHS